jgi:hypothetical protein
VHAMCANHSLTHAAAKLPLHCMHAGHKYGAPPTCTPSLSGVKYGKRSVRGAVAATQASVPLPWCTSKSSSATRWMPLCLQRGKRHARAEGDKAGRSLCVDKRLTLGDVREGKPGRLAGAQAHLVCRSLLTMQVVVARPDATCLPVAPPA